MSLLKPKTDANSLSNRFVAARASYIAERNAIIDAAVARQNVIEETVRDLEVEDEALEALVQDARKG